MELKHLTLMLVFSLEIWIKLVKGTTCLPRFHPFTEFKLVYDVYKREDFSDETSRNFTEIIIDNLNKNLLIGARNYLFVLDAENFVLKKNVSWKNDESTRKCLNSGRGKRNCQNYIQLIKPYQDKLFICGTNAMSPVYNITKLNDPSSVVIGNKNAKDQCSLIPDHQPVATFSRLNELIASTFIDKNGRGPVISGSYFDERKSSWHPIKTKLYSLEILRYPDFKASFAIYPSVFIFFNEAAVERSEQMYASVARICQADNGGSMHILENQWTTFRKTRLECIVTGYEDMKFNLLKHIAWNKEAEHFYGVFETSNSSFKASAMCVFSLADLKSIFEGDFLYRKDTISPWGRVANPRHFTECTINPASLNKYSMKTYNETVQPGKQPTNFMTGKALTDSYRYLLMYNSLKAIPRFSFYRKLERFTTVATVVVKSDAKQSHVLLYIGTDQGTIVVLHVNSAKKLICVLDEIHLFQDKNVEKIKKLELWKEKQQLFVGTDERVIKLSMDVCSRYRNKSYCINAHHPLCGWVKSKGKCISIQNSTNEKKLDSGDFLQDLSKCPSKKGYWSPWSSWHICKDNNYDRYCRCRKRRCRTCNENDCIGNSIQINNCSATSVDDKQSWLSNGVIDGLWSSWSHWSVCDQDSCGSGFQTRERSCSEPKPKNGGLHCIGAKRECRKCDAKPSSTSCIHKTVKGLWSNCICFLEEGKSMSVGVQFRVKTCFSSCGDKKGCPRDQIQNRTCFCTNKPKVSGKPGELFTSVPHTVSSSSRTAGRRGFQLTDIVIAVVGTSALCLVLCLISIFCIIKRKKKKTLNNTKLLEDEDLSRLPLRSIEPNHAHLSDDVKRPSSSDSEMSLENNKRMVPISLDTSVVVGMAFKTTNKSPRNGKLKMFGEDQDYEMGITSF